MYNVIKRAVMTVCDHYLGRDKIRTLRDIRSLVASDLRVAIL